MDIVEQPRSLSEDKTWPTVHLSCVVDDNPKFRLQAWNWLCGLRALGTRCRLFVHHVRGALGETLQAEMREHGVTLVEIEPYGDGPAVYCNKIRQLETREFLEADFVVLSDTDIAFLRDPADLVEEGKFRAKVVDNNNPPEEMWRQLAALCGITGDIPTVALELAPEVDVFATNFNGGVYVMPSDFARQIHPLWEKHARTCLDAADLLGKYAGHCDQLGMGFALLESQIPVSRLPTTANLPTHIDADTLGVLEPGEVWALHYHNRLDAHGLLRKTGVSWIDEAIERCNTTLVAQRRRAFSNEIFWDFRYAQFPDLGSGLGSRGDVLSHKRALLEPYFDLIASESILDVGCGDLELFAPLPLGDYTGIDVSGEALRIASRRRPEWTFLRKDLSDFPDDSFDYVTCMDVLIHQPNEAAARDLVDNLVRVARKGVFFSAHTTPIKGAGISFNSAEMLAFISSLKPVSAVHRLGSYRDVSLHFAEKGLGDRRSRNDIGLHQRVIGSRYTDYPHVLRELVDYSRQHLGFFPFTISRTHEYPWFAEQLRDVEGKSVLDIGAGICCVPLILAQRGARVTTVDRHDRIRTGPPTPQWNEWGYLDYSELDARIRSFNIDASEFDDDERYDVIYSISVIEHMPRSTRRAVMAQAARLLKPDGEVLLSLDLIPGTDDLWNLNEGKIVDETGHGDLDMFKAELAAQDLVVRHEEYVRAMPGSRTDVVYLKLGRPRHVDEDESPA